jgi:hypothetical protein
LRTENERVHQSLQAAQAAVDRLRSFPEPVRPFWPVDAGGAAHGGSEAGDAPGDFATEGEPIPPGDDAVSVQLSQASSHDCGLDSLKRRRNRWFAAELAPPPDFSHHSQPVTKEERERIREYEKTRKASRSVIMAYTTVADFHPFRLDFIDVCMAQGIWLGVDHTYASSPGHPSVAYAARQTAFSLLCDALVRGGRADFILDTWKHTSDVEALWNALCVEYTLASKTGAVSRARTTLKSVVQGAAKNTLQLYNAAFLKAVTHLRHVQRHEGRSIETDAELLDEYRAGLNDHHMSLLPHLYLVTQLQPFIDTLLTLSFTANFSGVFTDERRRATAHPPSARALLAGDPGPARPDTRTCHTCDLVGHVSRNCTTLAADFKCTYCSRLRHLARACRKRLADEAAGITEAKPTVASGAPRPTRPAKTTLAAQATEAQRLAKERATQRTAQHQRSLLAIEALAATPSRTPEARAQSLSDILTAQIRFDGAVLMDEDVASETAEAAEAVVSSSRSSTRRGGRAQVTIKGGVTTPTVRPRRFVAPFIGTRQ